MKSKVLLTAIAVAFWVAACSKADDGAPAGKGEQAQPAQPASSKGEEQDRPAEHVPHIADQPTARSEEKLEAPSQAMDMAMDVEKVAEEAKMDRNSVVLEDRMERAKRMVSDRTVVGMVGADFGAGSGAAIMDGLGGAGGAGGLLALAKGDDKKDQEKKKIETWKRSELVPNTSKLTIGDKEELPLKGMEVNVDVSGFRARVMIDFHFENDRAQQYEGTFKLRLPDKATPYFFAFGQTAVGKQGTPVREPVMTDWDSSRRLGLAPGRIMEDRRAGWQEPKEARMVPKEKAAYAYTETVRRRVDPALMEWSGAGVFNSRVFPIAPNSLYRIVIAYDVDLTPMGKDLEYRFDVPQDIPKMVVNVGVKQLEDVVVTVAPKTKSVEAQGVAHHRFEDPKARTISVRLSNPGPLLLTGADEKVGPLFAARFTPELSANSASGSSNAIFLVDVSLSSSPDQFNVWLKLLRSILDNNRTDLTSFSVLFFNVEGFWWREQFVDNTPENVEDLMQFANSLALEGATDLGAALQRASAPAWLGHDRGPASWDLFLLSDGAITWGEGDLYSLTNLLARGQARSLFAYRSGFQGTDSRVLEHLTRQTGGAIFSVVGEAELTHASTAHRFRPWLIQGLEVAGGSDLLLAGRPLSLFPGQSLVLVGRGTPARGTQVVLALKQGDVVQNYRVALDRSVESDLTPRTYGQAAVGQLEEFKTEAEEVATAFARHFRITGQTCSLLMLESEADYLRFDIKPEEDAFVVKTNYAAGVVAEVMAKAQEILGDPKAAFMAWLEKMEGMPFIGVKVPTALRMALKRLPNETFAVVPRPLTCKSHDWKSIPASIREQLESKSLDYDELSGEAEERFKKHGAADALKSLSSLVENSPGDTVLARDVGFSAMEFGLGGQAYHLFRRVADSRPHEPQTYRAMALCLAEMGIFELATAYFELSLAGNWDSRFGEFRRIVGMDYLRFLKRLAAEDKKTEIADFADARLETLSKEFDVGQADLVVSITWNTDQTDVDLHIVEPTGEECYYSHPTTRLGGQLSSDVTQGYGPEMYVLKHAGAGNYKITANYFSSNRNRASTRTKVYATVYRNWGTPNEKVFKKVVDLADNKQVHEIMDIVIKK